MNKLDSIKIGSNNYQFRDNTIQPATQNNEGLIKIANQQQVNTGLGNNVLITSNTLLNWSGNVVQAYGVIYNPNQSSPVCQKIQLVGSNIKKVSKFSSALFAHRFKRCVMDDLSARHINYYLDQFDSTKKIDGSAAVLTGQAGDVMVEIPITYWRVTQYQDGRIEYLISDHYFIGSQIHPFFYVSPGGNTPRIQYVGAYQATICDATGARIANMMNQTSTWPTRFVTGYKARSVAGCKPWTNMTLATLRTAAKNNGGITINNLFKQFLFLMMIIEGGSFNTQATISHGFAYADAGCLKWNYSFTRLSGRANFGNDTGSILADQLQDGAITWQNVTEDKKVVQFVYRGIENPYGHVWEFKDGIQKYENVVNGVQTDGCYWWTAATDLYTSDDQQAAANPVYQRVAHSQPTFGWPKTWDAKTFFPITVGGDSMTYMCDLFYPDRLSGSRLVFHGGRLGSGDYDGAEFVLVNQQDLAVQYSYFGGRIAC